MVSETINQIFPSAQVFPSLGPSDVAPNYIYDFSKPMMSPSVTILKEYWKQNGWLGEK